MILKYKKYDFTYKNVKSATTKEKPAGKGG